MNPPEQPDFATPKLMRRSAAAVSEGDQLITSPYLLKWLSVLFPVCFIWYRLIDSLWLEWTTNPQYGYGVLVPFLCMGLLIRRWHSFTCSKESPPPWEVSWPVLLLVGLLGFFYLPTRLIEAATPEWRPIQWLLGIEAIGLSLCCLRIGWGRGWMRQLAFPICFFLVAIPWPSPVESPIIQNLTQISAVFVTNLLSWFGVPALTHGNVIEVTTGLVGIDEACSGIRSFQSSLMISLCLGEFYRLSSGRRWLLILLGFIFSLAFNVARMSFLTLIAARKGVSAISQYHDPAGVTITILCTLSLLGVAALMAKYFSKKSNEQPGITSEEAANLTDSAGISTEAKADSGVVSPLNKPSQLKSLIWVNVGLLIWFALVEVGVYGWYAQRESHLVLGPAWTIKFPQDSPAFHELPISDDTRRLLRYDEGRQAAWTEADGARWQGFYFNWQSGRVAGYLAKRHTPEICLAATGCKLLSGPELTMLNVHGVELPMRNYIFESSGEVVYVFQCRWEAGAQDSAYVNNDSLRYNLVRAIWTSRGKLGQKVLEFVVSGKANQEQAREALRHQLDGLVQLEN